MKKGFSLAEMMIVLLIIGILCVAMAPVAVRMFRRDVIAPLHGSYECYYDSNDNLYEVLRDEDGKLISKHHITDADYCTFKPNAHSIFFLINAIGGGSGGYGTATTMKSAIPNNGADYLDELSQHADYIFGIGSTINLKYLNNNDWKWVYDKLSSTGISLVAMLTSNGGTTPGSIQSAYNHKDKAGCDVENPPFNDYKSSGCYTYKYQSGVSGSPGGRYRFKVDVFDGTSILSRTTKGDYNGIGLAVSRGSISGTTKAYGCFLPNGDDGCYNEGCKPKSHAIENFDSGYACQGYSGNSTYGGYPYTAPTQDYWFREYNDSDLGCYFSTCELDGSMPPGVTSCSMNYCHVLPAVLNYPIATAQIFGNAVNISRMLKSGVNFYAQSGNVGTYRTMYISRFKKSVIVKPGKGGGTAAAGGNTILKYEGDSDVDALMTVMGGTAPSSTNPVVAGRHFELSSSKITYEDKDKASKDSYNSYFGYKNGSFVYPTMANNISVPDSVGDSGRGAYSIFRTTGVSDKYTLKVNGTTYTNTQTPTSLDKSSYTCTESGEVLGASDKYCSGVKGKGGAVVITW